MQFTNEQLRDCAKRELAMRRRVFPRWIEQKRITPQNAEIEIAKMEAIEKHFDALASRERLL
jgi:hypothetical protein